MSDSNPRIENLPAEVDMDSDDRHPTVEVNVGAVTDMIHLNKAKLVVIDGPDRGKQLVLDKPIIRIGSNEKNDLLLTDNTVSRFHCEIRNVRDEWLLDERDLRR